MNNDPVKQEVESTRIWQADGYVKAKMHGNKLYFSAFRLGMTRITKYSRRAFKTATFAINYGRGVLARYDRLRAAAQAQ